MSVRELERSIWEEAKKVTGNPKMKLKELLEWSTGDIKPRDNEVVVYLPEHKVNIAVPVMCDKRPRWVEGEPKTVEYPPSIYLYLFDDCIGQSSIPPLHKDLESIKKGNLVVLVFVGGAFKRYNHNHSLSDLEDATPDETNCFHLI